MLIDWWIYSIVTFVVEMYYKGLMWYHCHHQMVLILYGMDFWLYFVLQIQCEIQVRKIQQIGLGDLTDVKAASQCNALRNNEMQCSD